MRTPLSRPSQKYRRTHGHDRQRYGLHMHGNGSPCPDHHINFLHRKGQKREATRFLMVFLGVSGIIFFCNYVILDNNYGKFKVGRGRQISSGTSQQRNKTSEKSEAFLYLGMINRSQLGYYILVIVMLYFAYNGTILANSKYALGIQIAAILLMVWSRITLGKRSFNINCTYINGELVTTGPYKYVRHPIYLSIICFTIPVILSQLYLTNILIAFLTMFAIAIRIFSEEKILRVNCPHYSLYSIQTKSIIPYLL